MDFPPLSQSPEFLSLAIKRLKPSKSVGLGDIPGFVITCCSAICIHNLRHIFNLRLTQ
jgi:hypothetical protein